MRRSEAQGRGRGDHGRTTPPCRSLHIIYILFGNAFLFFGTSVSVTTFFCNTYLCFFLAVIFFSLLLILIILNIILLSQLAEDEAQLQLYLEHYSRSWLSALILLLTVATLFFALTIVIFSIYMLRRKSRLTVSTGRSHSGPGRSRSEVNRFFSETTSTSTVTRTRPDSRPQRNSSIRLFGNGRQQRLVESIHVEKSITFH